MAEAEFDYLVKFIIIGDSATGKTCLLRQFLEGKFPRTSTHTVGVEFGCKQLAVEGARLKVQIWDTAGQERFRSVTRSYYRGTAAALVVYDVTRPETFSHVKDWIAEARSLASPGTVLSVVGNKADLKADRQVSYEAGQRLCEEQHLPFAETSALSGLNVQEVFTQLAEAVLKQMQSGALPASFVRAGELPRVQRGACSC
jgi:small GTP-binding protein